MATSVGKKKPVRKAPKKSAPKKKRSTPPRRSTAKKPASNRGTTGNKAQSKSKPIPAGGKNRTDSYQASSTRRREAVEQSKSDKSAERVSSLTKSLESSYSPEKTPQRAAENKAELELAKKDNAQEISALKEDTNRSADSEKKLAEAEKRAETLEKAEQKQTILQPIQLAYLGQNPNGSLNPADSFAGRIESAGENGPITAEQAAEFSRELDGQEAPADPAKLAAFEKKQAEARTLIAEAQTPLMSERLGIQSDSQALERSLGEYTRLQGPRVESSLRSMREFAPDAGPFGLALPQKTSPEQAAKNKKLAKLNEDLTAQNRQALRDGRLNFDPKDPKGRQFPNFSESLGSLELQQKALNEKYKEQGIDQQSNSPALAQTRKTLEGADDYLRRTGANIDRSLNGSQNPTVFGETPVTSPIHGAQTQGSPETFAADKKTIDDLSRIGVKPQDMYLSPATHEALGVKPNTAPKNDSNISSKSFLYGDLQGQDVSRANLDAYHTRGKLYDKDTKFAEGFSPVSAGMTRQLGADESYETHIREQKSGQKQQYATRVLETNNQFPNPDYNPNDPKSSATVDRKTFQERYTERQIEATNKNFSQEKAYVEKAGGYDQAVKNLREQALEKFPTPTGGGHSGLNARKKARANQQAEFNRLVAQHMPNHYQANQDALSHIRGEAIGSTTQALGERPPTSRPSTPTPRTPQAGKDAAKAKTEKFEAFSKEYNKLKTEQLDQLREQKLNELQRRDIQSAINVDRDELDQEWAKVGGEKIQAEAAKAWQGMSVDQRRDAMAQVSAERIDMARYQANELHRSGLQNEPEKAARLADNHASVDKTLDALRKDLAAGKIEEVEAKLRNDNPSMNLMEFSSPENKASKQTFEQNVADRQAQKEAAYQANGWWEDSPYAGQHNGAFMQDLHQREMLSISPNDAAKGLHTLEQMNKSGDLPQEQYDAMKSKLSRAYDLGRVGHATRALDKQFGQMVDDQGVVGDFANGVKNQLGRPNGWVIDSNLGSDAINGQLAQAHRTRELINEMAHFKGTDAEFREQYKQHVDTLQSQVKGIETQMGGFQQSQDNWVEGISDVASVSAGLALAPVTGGASLVAVPLASGAVKVAVKGLEAGTGNRGYQGSVLKDFGKGALNGLSAYGTNKLAGLAETAFMAGRTPGAATWLGQRAITAVEGGVDGFISGTTGSLIDGNDLGTSLEQGGRGALVGSVLAPTARTVMEGAGALRQADIPSNPDVVPANGFSQNPSKLRMDGSQVDSQARQYLESQGLDPAAVDKVDFHAGQRPDGTAINTAETTVRPDGGADVYLPTDGNGRVLAHEAGHELDHALLAQRAAAGDSGAQAALREAQANYAKLEELRAQGAPVEELQKAQSAYQNSLAEHSGEAAGNGFAVHQLDQLGQTRKPKSGKPQNVEALERTQKPLRQAQEAHQAAAERAVPAQVEGPVPQRLAHDPKLEKFSPEQREVITGVKAQDSAGGLRKSLDDAKANGLADEFTYNLAVAKRTSEVLGFDRSRPHGASELAGNPQKLAQFKELYESAGPRTKAQMAHELRGAVDREIGSFKRSIPDDPAAARAAFLEKRAKLEELHKSVTPQSLISSSVDDAIKEFDGRVAARKASVGETHDWQPNRPQKRIDTEMTAENYRPGKPSFWSGKIADAPPMIGTKLSKEQAEKAATEFEQSLAKYAGKSDVPRPEYSTATPENTYFSQGDGPRVQFGTIKKPEFAPGVEGYIKSQPDAGPRVVEFPMEDGTFRYLMVDGHHRGAAQMMQGGSYFEDAQVVRLGDMKRAADVQEVLTSIRRLHKHLYMTDYPVPR